MEVNSSPGLEGIQKSTGVTDVAEAIIDHIEPRIVPGLAQPVPDPDTGGAKQAS